MKQAANQTSDSCLLYTDNLFRLLFDPEDGGDTFSPELRLIFSELHGIMSQTIKTSYWTNVFLFAFFCTFNFNTLYV
jgi:hypothetical protein